MEEPLKVGLAPAADPLIFGKQEPEAQRFG